MLRRTLTPLALVCALVLSACSDSKIPTSPDAADLNGTSLQAAKLAGAGSLTGEVGGAKYYIEVPENWNGDLVLFAPGYISPTFSADDLEGRAGQLVPARWPRPGRRTAVIALAVDVEAVGAEWQAHSFDRM